MVSNDVNDVNIIIQQALDNTTSQLLERLKQIIQENVYNSYQETWGGRTGQFKESWISDMANVIGDIVETHIFQDINIMDIDESIKSHIQREYLAEIIESGEGYNFGDAPARPYWSIFLDYVDNNLDTIFIMNCKLLGLDVGKGVVMAL